jgi:hypothetical protein
VGTLDHPIFLPDGKNAIHDGIEHESDGGKALLEAGPMIKSLSTPLAASLMAALVLSSALVSAADLPSAPRPTLLVGDRWVYNVTSGFGLTKMTYQETREVTTVDASGIKVKVTGKTVDGRDFTRVEDLPAAGELRSGAPCIDQAYRFPTPLQRVVWPIVPGERSAKWVDAVSEPSGVKGQFNYSFHTVNWDKQTVPAGSFDAIRVDVSMMLNDATAFRHGTQCNFTYWYSPAVRGTVRERRTAMYNGAIAVGDTQVLNSSYELASFTPGK